MSRTRSLSNKRNVIGTNNHKDAINNFVHYFYFSQGLKKISIMEIRCCYQDVNKRTAPYNTKSMLNLGWGLQIWYVMVRYSRKFIISENVISIVKLSEFDHVS